MPNGDDAVGDDDRMKSTLKSTLSACLAWVKGGRELVVTERARPIAKIVPLLRNSSAETSHLAELERAGLARIGSGRLPEDFWEIPRPRDDQGAALRMLLEERETGR